MHVATQDKYHADGILPESAVYTFVYIVSNTVMPCTTLLLD